MTASQPRSVSGSRRDVFALHAQLFSIAGFFVVMVTIFAVASPTFLTVGNVLNLVRQASPILVVAVAMTFVITTGGIDLSVGSIVALVNALAAIGLRDGWPWPLVAVGLIAVGGIIGALQGWFVAYQGIQAFIVTLAGLSTLRGLALLLTQGFSIPIATDLGFVQIGRAYVLGVPAPAWIAFGVASLGFVVLWGTRFGRYVTAIGANSEAARRAGVATKAITLAVYALSGATAALAGIVLAARLGSGSSNAAVGFELDVIAAVVLGGTSLAGGRGSMLGDAPRRIDDRGDRQRADPRPRVALLHADRDGVDHPLRGLAQRTRIFAPRGRAERSVLSELSEAHVGSGLAMTVDGPVTVDALGTTLMHEHLVNDCRCWWHRPGPERAHLATSPVHAGILGELRMDPFVNLDNCSLDDAALAAAELLPFKAAGGRTVVDPTCRGIGRDPSALRAIATATGLQIVMGSGYYLQTSHPPEVAGMSADAIADEIVAEALHGVEGGGVKIGLIGEIGVSGDFTADEEKSLRGAAKAQARCGLPIMVHLPAWYRHGGRVLDILEAEGADVAHAVLCHMNPSGEDVAYQTALARRGAYLEYDMIGMDFWYADQGVQCPSDEDNARAIARLVDLGHLERILLSQDVFLKMMLTRYGGFGYAYVVTHFAARLRRHGVGDAAIATMLVDNPRRVFGG